jgi:hypothetical protein
MNLNDPTPKEEIKQRQGPGGRMLDYIDARFVMDRLDAAVGPTDWQDRYEDLPNGSVRCGIGIRYGEDWVWKWDVGDPSDIEATKGAHSDAFKRAGVKWGIGRDLYGDHTVPTRAPARTAAPTGGSTGNGRPTSPRAANANAATSAATTPAGFPSDEPPWPADHVDAIAAAESIFAGSLDESKCPDHNKPYKSGAKGWFCATPVEKDGDRVVAWCKRRPSKAWAAAQELAPA